MSVDSEWESSPLVKRGSGRGEGGRGRSRDRRCRSAAFAWPEGVGSGGYIEGLALGMRKAHLASVVNRKAEYMDTQTDW